MVKHESGQVIYDEQDQFDLEIVGLLVSNDRQSPRQSETDAAFTAIALLHEAMRLRSRGEMRSNNVALRAERLWRGLYAVVDKRLLSVANVAMTRHGN